jgi:hypothetical protein
MAGLWILSLGLVGYAASQGRIVYPKGKPEVILTGDDLGFRLEGHQGGARTGTFVVRIDGKWVEARSAVKVVPVR